MMISFQGRGPMGNVPKLGGNLGLERCPLCLLKWSQTTETKRQRRQQWDSTSG